MSQVVASQGAVWEQVRRVRSGMLGGPWHQTFATGVPVPAWLVQLATGRSEGYVGPDPVLFRTAGIGMEWFTALDAHPRGLVVTCAHDETPAAELRACADQVAAAGGLVDADAYVWGDGDADGVMTIRIHRLFGVFPPDALLTGLRESLQTVAARFAVTESRTRVGTTLQVLPRLTVGEVAR